MYVDLRVSADTQNVTKGTITKCVKQGLKSFAEVKAKTKAGAGCGGCVPLATAIFNSEMKKAGHKLNTKYI
jgi:nitrite reductase (NAD(P)H)